MKFTRSDFYQHIFEPYNKAVKEGKYVKIEYNLWRILRDWCCDDQWYNFEIVVEPISSGYNLYLRDDLRIAPEMITLVHTEKKDFAKYLEDKIGDYWQFDLEFQKRLCEKLNSIGARYYAIASDGNTTLNIPVVNNIVVKEKENKEMKFNFDFGPVDSSVRMSLYGMAIKNASGTYVAYDANIKQVMDVDIFNFEGANKFIYKMPAAIKDIRVGDVVIHARKPMFVQKVCAENRLNVLDIYDGEEKTIVLSKSPFGFDFITKVVSLVNLVGSADTSNPFGNMLPILLLSESKNAEDILPLMLMTQGGNGFASNPMLMYALMSKDGKMNDMLPFLLMSNCASPVLPTGCNGACACHADSDKPSK